VIPHNLLSLHVVASLDLLPLYIDTFTWPVRRKGLPDSHKKKLGLAK